MHKFIRYAPRVLAILIVAFFALFILEGFSPQFEWQDALMHFLLALVALGCTVVAWKWPGIGGWLFALIGLYFLPHSSSNLHPWNGIIIGGVPILTGILFLLEAMISNRKRKSSTPAP